MRDIVRIVHSLNTMNRIIKQLEEIDRQVTRIKWTLDELVKPVR